MFKRLMLVMLLIITPLRPAAATDVDNELDIVGIRLGMDKFEVKSVMLRHNAGIEFERTKRSIAAAENYTYERITGSSKAQKEIIIVEFWSPPSQKVSGYIVRQKTYRPIQRPTINAAKEAFFDKYGMPSYQDESDDAEINLVWMFDKNKVKLSAPYTGKDFTRNDVEARTCLKRAGISGAPLTRKKGISTLGLSYHYSFAGEIRQCKYTLLLAKLFIDIKLDTVKRITTLLTNYYDVLNNYTKTLEEYKRREQEKVKTAKDVAKKVPKPTL